MIAWNFQRIVGTCQFRVPWFGYPCGYSSLTIEAKECGLPEISFDCKEGPSEIIEDGVDGYIIPVNDNEMFIEKLVMLAKDKEKRVNFSEHSKINAKRFSSTNVSNLWKEMLEQV